MIPPIAGHQLFLFIIQFALLLTSARVLGEMMKRYSQPPVFGELLAGIVLGPSLLGWLFPSLSSVLFPADVQQYHLLELISWLGMIFLLLFTGLETDLALLRRLGRPAALASLLGIIVPFAFGYLLGTTIPDHLLVNPEQRLIFQLFLGTALAISAVPVIAKILLDLDILKRNIGAIIMAAAIVDDIAGWTILSMLMGMMAKGTLDVTAVVQGVASTMAFVGVALVVGVRVVRRVLRWVDERVQVEEAHITAILVVTLVCAAITEAIGIHAVFGAFVAGVLFAQSPRVRANALEKLVGVVQGVFTPVFFAFVGLRVDLTQLQDPRLVGLVLVTACAGKLIGCTLRRSARPFRLVGGGFHRYWYERPRGDGTDYCAGWFNLRYLEFGGLQQFGADGNGHIPHGPSTPEVVIESYSTLERRTGTPQSHRATEHF